MEGSYNKVLSAKQDGLYSQEGMFFMDMLVDTVRDEIAECSEKAYDSIALADLQTLLMLGSEAELREFAETVRLRRTPSPSPLPAPWPRPTLWAACGAERVGRAGRQGDLWQQHCKGCAAAVDPADPADALLRQGAGAHRLSRVARRRATVGWSGARIV